MNTDYPPEPQNAGGPDSPKVGRESVRAGHEVTDVSVTGLALFFAGLAGVVVTVLVGIALFLRVFGAVDQHLDKNIPHRETGAASRIHVRPQYTGPELQIVPEKDLGAMKTANSLLLDHYAWIDRKEGVVSLPVERAMDLLVKRGIPPVSPGQTLESIQQQRAQPQVYGQVLKP